MGQSVLWGMRMTIGIGLIGCGYWGPNLLRNFHANPKARVVAVADRDAARRRFVEQRYPGVGTVEDHRWILDDPEIDAVVVATPAATHGVLAREALEKGKHVLVEKPLAMSGEEAAALVELAEARGLVVMPGHTFLYNAAVEALKRYVDEGTLGEIYYLYSQRLNLGIVRSDVNAMWNLAPHDVSIVLHLFGESPGSVSAQGACYLQEGIEDVVFMDLRFPSGRLAHIHVSWLDPGKVRRMTVVGSERMCVYDDIAEAKIALYDRGIDRHFKQPADYGLHQLVKRAGDILLPKIDFVEPLAKETAAFLQAVESGEPPLADGPSGLEVVRVLEACQRSLEAEGRPIALAAS
ncbi:MAG: gfo/Idh/MocA family oxidoreductase [Deltaproteobacteria bacterium]|nr:MAG: gfo/Idh/MocA family oxidoreductase [Deltaproteobacteria bacterium]